MRLLVARLFSIGVSRIEAVTDVARSDEFRDVDRVRLNLYSRCAHAVPTKELTAGDSLQSKMKR